MSICSPPSPNSQKGCNGSGCARNLKDKYTPPFFQSLPFFQFLFGTFKNFIQTFPMNEIHPLHWKQKNRGVAPLKKDILLLIKEDSFQAVHLFFFLIIWSLQNRWIIKHCRILKYICHVNQLPMRLSVRKKPYIWSWKPITSKSKACQI